MRGCPACRKEWPADREVCPDCLARLVDDLNATITCRQCGHVCPARMHTCPSCFAVLRAEDIDTSAALAHAMATGRPMHRPPGRAAFAEGVECRVERLSAGGPLLLIGPDGLIEAAVVRVVPGSALPLRCEADDEVLFRMARYGAADDAVVATGPDGAALATFLRVGGLLEPSILIRDETSAPVATLRRPRDGVDFEVVETGGGVVATCAREDVGDDNWVDDAWELTIDAEPPMQPMAFVALAVAVKLLLGRPDPVRIPDLDRLPGGRPGAIDVGIGPDLDL